MTVDARTFALFIQYLEDGKIHTDLSEALKEIGQELRDHAQAFGGNPKAQLTLKIDFQLKDGITHITTDYGTKLPKVRRPLSVMWANAEGVFTPENPKQLSIFGPRAVGEDPAVARSV